MIAFKNSGEQPISINMVSSQRFYVQKDKQVGSKP